MLSKRILWLCLISTLFTLLLIPTVVQAQNPVWTGDYYNNQYLSGDPTFSRTDSNIAFDWGLGSPGADIPADNFSVRWSTDIVLSPGTYRFWARADDDVQIIFNFRNPPIIDTFDQQAVGQLISVDVNVSETATYHIQVDYRELTHNAYAYVAFANAALNPTTPPFGSPVQPPPGTGFWTGAYYANTTLSGNPAGILSEVSPTHFWGSGAPLPAVPADNFSARWSTVQDLSGGNYQIRANADDGVRVYVDNSLIINEWHLATPGTYTANVALSPGQHSFIVEYYEAGGSAFIDYDLLQVGAPPPVQPPPPETGVTATVLAYRLNVRDFPSTEQGDIIGRIAENETYAVLARDPANAWYLIDVHSTRGWVSARWVTINPPNATLPISNPADIPENPPPAPEGPTATATPFTVNIRTGPSTLFNRIGRFPAGEMAQVIGRNGDSTWWQINFNGVVGWVSAQYAVLQQGVDVNSIPVTG